MYTNICMYIQKGHARTTRVCVVIFERERERAQSFETTCTTHTTYTNIHTCTHTHIHTHTHTYTHTSAFTTYTCTHTPHATASALLNVHWAVCLRTATHSNTLHHVGNTLQQPVERLQMLQRAAVCCSALQCVQLCCIAHIICRTCRATTPHDPHTHTSRERVHV